MDLKRKTPFDKPQKSWKLTLVAGPGLSWRTCRLHLLICNPSTVLFLRRLTSEATLPPFLEEKPDRVHRPQPKIRMYSDCLGFSTSSALHCDTLISSVLPPPLPLPSSPLNQTSAVPISQLLPLPLVPSPMGEEDPLYVVLSHLWTADHSAVTLHSPLCF